MVATAVATAGLAGTGGAGSAAADASAPAGSILLSGPSGVLVVDPTGQPAAQPSPAPSRPSQPAGAPQPTDQPTNQPAAQPNQPANQPADQPTGQPTGGPTTQPTGQATGQPTNQPAVVPNQPGAQPTQPASTPELRITLAYERHDRDLVITLTFSGYVFRPYSSKTGQIEEYPIPAKRDIGTYEHLDWGDGTSYTAAARAQRCPVGTEKRMVHQVADRYQLRKTYRRGGDYTLNYEYDACGLTNGKIAGQLRMHVP
jgi:hypothetical protein